MNVSSNGNVQFTSNSDQVGGLCLPFQGLANAIYTHWEDLATVCDACGVFTSVSGEAPNRVFNVEWRTTYYLRPGYADFALRLYESPTAEGGHFDIVYAQVDDTGTNATVGAQRGTGTNLTVFTCQSSILYPGLLVDFTVGDPPTSTPTETPTVGPTNTPTETSTPTPCSFCDYTYTTSPNSAFEPGTNDTGITCDDCTGHLDLPFTYLFYDHAFDSMNVSSNGNVQFASDNPEVGGVCVPYAGFNEAVFVHWNDLVTVCDGCGVFTSVTGSAPNRVFNVEWRANYYGRSESAHFELRLYEGERRFDVVFAELNDTGAGTTVGVQRGTGTNFTEFACQSETLEPGMLVSFTGGDGSAPTATSAFRPKPTATAVQAPLPESCVPVTFESGRNVTVAGNSLTKSGGLGAQWDAGAVSQQALAKGDGSARLTVADAGTSALFGLSNHDTGSTERDVDFALVMDAGTLRVYERGEWRGDFGPYKAGDLLRVAVKAGVVSYYRNGVRLYASKQSPAYPLRVDTSIMSRGGRIENLYACGFAQK
jgi:hypothetical protein